MAILIKNALLVTMDRERRILRGDLLAEGDRIVRVGALHGRDMVGLSHLSSIEASELWCLPGFVQTHVHLCQSLFRNQAEELPLLDWLSKRIWPLEAAMDMEAMEASARLGIAELVAGGTTCILDMGSVRHTEVIFEVAKQTGLRFIGGKAMMDDPSCPAGLRETTAESLRMSDRLARTWDGAEGGRLRYAYAPRFALSCTDVLLREVGDRVEAGARVHTHASESRAECDIVRKTRGADNLRYLDSTGLCGPRSVVAHCVWPAEGEIDLLASTRTAVAHCPSSNLKLGSGVAPIPEMLAKGVRLGLGADGAPCNNSLDMFAEMRLASLLQKPRLGPAALPAKRVVELATIDGAAALGLNDEIGSLEEGKKADFILVDPRGAHCIPVGDPYTTLVHSLRATDVRATVIAGRLLFRDGEHIGLNPDALRHAVSRHWDRVRTAAGL